MTAADCLCRTAIDRLDEDDFRGALELARAGLRRDENHSGLLRVYGLAAYHLDEPWAALSALETATTLAPLDPVSQLALVDLYLLLGHRKSAAAGLSFLIEPGRCPNQLLPDLARLLGKYGAYRSAFKVCRRLTRQRPWYHPAFYGMAFYLAKLGHSRTNVIRHLRTAVTLAPNAIPYRVALAAALARAGKFEEACDLVRSVPVGAISCPKCLERLQSAAEVIRDVELAMRLRDRLREVLSVDRDKPESDPFDQ